MTCIDAGSQKIVRYTNGIDEHANFHVFLFISSISTSWTCGIYFNPSSVSPRSPCITTNR